MRDSCERISLLTGIAIKIYVASNTRPVHASHVPRFYSNAEARVLFGVSLVDTGSQLELGSVSIDADDDLMTRKVGVGIVLYMFSQPNAPS